MIKTLINLLLLKTLHFRTFPPPGGVTAQLRAVVAAATVKEQNAELRRIFAILPPSSLQAPLCPFCLPRSLSPYKAGLHTTADECQALGTVLNLHQRL